MIFVGVPGLRIALAATSTANEDDQSKSVSYTVSFSPGTGASELFAIRVHTRIFGEQYAGDTTAQSL